MTLRAKLTFSTIIEVLLVVLVSGLLISSSIQARQASIREGRASEIVKAISEIRFVTFENLLHHDQRSFEQWQSRHSSLAALLEPIPSQGPAERNLAEKISKSSIESSIIFNRLVASYNEAPPGETPNNQKVFQTRLATQLLTKQQTEISDALQIAALAREQSTTVRQRFIRRAGIAIFLMLLITAANFFYVTRTITNALAVFQKAATRIASGDFNYRIKLGKRRDEIGQLGSAFNSMASSLRHIDKVKSEFILLASHQLRTPLTAIKWITEELHTPRVQSDQGMQASYTRQIEESNNRMIQLVDELLEASKVSLGTLPVSPQSTKLDSVIGQVIQDLTLQIQERKIKLVLKIDKELKAVLIDRTWAHIIFQNLLSNAIKYSPNGTEVKVVVTNDKSHIQVSIIDQGYGIPKNQQDKIFTKLFRADNARTIIGEGSGLGLYITKAMVERSGGSVTFESIENKGTTFYVKLPFIQKSISNAARSHYAR